jgi:hypothetical protein
MASLDETRAIQPHATHRHESVVANVHVPRGRTELTALSFFAALALLAKVKGFKGCVRR